MAKVIAVMNEKGGVGKTATSTSLSYLLSKKGFKTALIDFDGQGHSSIILGVRNINNLDITINTIIRRIIEGKSIPESESYVIKTDCGVDLIPSNSQLFTLERNLCNVDFRERILRQYVDTIRDDYDYIIIDCMPQMGTPMINVMMCADSIIIPTQAEILAAQGLTELLKHYQVVRQNSNHNLTIAGVLITMDSADTVQSKTVNALIQKGFSMKVPIFSTHIPRSTKVGEAVLHYKTICEFKPDNSAALAYELFVNEFLANEAVRAERMQVS